MSWGVILRWRHTRPPLTPDEEAAQATVMRWIDRLARAPAAQRAYDAEGLARYEQHNNAWRQSISTTSSINKGQETFELASPQKVHLDHDR